MITKKPGSMTEDKKGLTVWSAPQKLDRKSNFWGVFIMKLTYEDKVQIYELRKQGISYSKLSVMFDVQKSNIKYMVKLIDRYGLEIVEKGIRIIILLN